MSAPIKAFIVHGPQPSVLRPVARLIDTATSLDAVVLGEHHDRAEAVIERYAMATDPACIAIVILSGDDVCAVGSRPTDALEPRPSQNVVLELGYFLGILPPERVIVLREEGVVGPSDVDGVAYFQLDTGWKHKLARELAGLGVTVDHTKITY